MNSEFYIFEKQYEKHICTECNTEILEGYIVELMNIKACSKACLEKRISYEDFLIRHDNGNGDAYWTDDMEWLND